MSNGSCSSFDVLKLKTVSNYPNWLLPYGSGRWFFSVFYLVTSVSGGRGGGGGVFVFYVHVLQSQPILNLGKQNLLQEESAGGEDPDINFICYPRSGASRPGASGPLDPASNKFKSKVSNKNDVDGFLATCASRSTPLVHSSTKFERKGI